MLLPGTRHHIGKITRVMEPGTVAIDADRHKQEALESSAACVIGRLKGDIVLGRDASNRMATLIMGIILSRSDAHGRACSRGPIISIVAKDGASSHKR